METSPTGEMPAAAQDSPRTVVLCVTDQVFTFRDDSGTEWHWNASAGMRIADASGRPPSAFYPSDHGLDIPQLLKQYPDLDLDYARKADTTRPILFVPFEGGTSVLIDGWHRLAGAILHEMLCLLCFELTEAERDEILVMKIPLRPRLTPMARARYKERKST